MTAETHGCHGKAYHFKKLYILFAYAADRTSRPTYICLPVGLVHARSGRVVERMGPKQEVTPLPGIYFFDAWRVEPCYEVPTDLPDAQNGP